MDKKLIFFVPHILAIILLLVVVLSNINLFSAVSNGRGLLVVYIIVAVFYTFICFKVYKNKKYTSKLFIVS